MNWEAVGALAEAIGVIAIFVSLIYVAVQIRQNSQQISRTIEADRLAAFERNVESGNHHRELLILHPDLLQLLLKGYKSYKKLAVPESQIWPANAEHVLRYAGSLHSPSIRRTRSSRFRRQSTHAR
jgi:hypothetical protein